MMVVEAETRNTAFGQGYRLTAADKLGIWLSARRIHSLVPSFRGLAVADVGCGYQALFARRILDEARRAFVIDVALAEDLKHHPKVTAIEAALPEALHGIGEAAIDVIVGNNVIEHLWEPLATLKEFRRVLAPGGVAFINVPSWRGKWFLEFSAFRLGTSPASEMNDHKMYYNAKDLWPLLVRAGFLPQNIRIGAHKFGLNTYATCRA
jgi:SAM-dependent methyltransferase